ncbi:MAG: hypothetical protein AAGJ38_04365 [Planctomycetota bacterium]
MAVLTGSVAKRIAGPTPKQLAPGVWWQRVGMPDAETVRIVVCVHGTGSNGRDELDGCVPFADSAFRHRGDSGVLLAPTFEVPYQFLEPDLSSAVLAWIDRAAEPYRVHRKIGLWGFSGGAQFVHRFALQHPGRVDRVAAFAAGEWTVPDGTHDGLMSRTAWFEHPPFDAYPGLREAATRPAAEGWESIRWLVGCGVEDMPERFESARWFAERLRQVNPGGDIRKLHYAGDHARTPHAAHQAAWAFLAEPDPPVKQAVATRPS